MKLLMNLVGKASFFFSRKRTAARQKPANGLCRFELLAGIKKNVTFMAYIVESHEI